jgi:hypothetical protein
VLAAVVELCAVTDGRGRLRAGGRVAAAAGSGESPLPGKNVIIFEDVFAKNWSEKWAIFDLCIDYYFGPKIDHSIGFQLVSLLFGQNDNIVTILAKCYDCVHRKQL